MSAAVAAAAAAACCSSRNSNHAAQNHRHEYSIADHHNPRLRRRPAIVVLSTLGSRYESRKRREWMSFIEYMKERRPGLVVSACSGDDAVEFLKYYVDGGDDQKQQVYWGSVEAIIGRLRVAFEDIMGGQAVALTTTNPFNAPEVRLYLRRLKDAHSHHHRHHHHNHHHQQQQQQLNSNSNFNNAF